VTGLVDASPVFREAAATYRGSWAPTIEVYGGASGPLPSRLQL